MLNSVEWGEYRLGDLFDVDSWEYGKNKKYHSILESPTYKSISVISGITENNGINYYTEDNLNENEIFESELTISTRGEYSGTVFYHNEEFVLANNILVMKMPNLTKNQKQFIGSLINALPYSGYGGYPRKEILKEDKIQLPIENEKINFSFMEDFIVKLGTEYIIELEANYILELEAYFAVTGLKNYILSDEEQLVLENFINDKFEWKEFRIEDVFQWQSQKEIDPLKLKKLKDESEMTYPFYGQSTINKGIISYNQLIKEVLNNKTAKPTILIHSNNQNIVYLETPFYLKDGHGATSVLQNEKLNKINQMFIICSIDKVIKSKYSYNNKATKIELKNTVIQLPSKNYQPDYEIMEIFTSAIQKLVIKDVVLYANKKIEAAKSIVNSK